MRMMQCPTCFGYGYHRRLMPEGRDPNDKFSVHVKCPRCKGAKRVRAEYPRPAADPHVPARCTRCGQHTGLRGGMDKLRTTCRACGVRLPKKPVVWVRDGLGLIVPSLSGVVYTHQTGGCACNHPMVEGAYVPLEGIEAVQGSMQDLQKLVRELAEKNYCKDTQPFSGDLWRRIKREVGFDFEVAPHPRGAVKTHEAWAWVRLTRVPEKQLTKLAPLIGRRVVLVYANSD